MASTAGDVVLAYLAAQVAEVRRLGPGAAAGRGEDIHQLRVAIRRLRSVLGSCRFLFDAGSVDTLRAELRWLAGVLGVARDPGVVRARLSEAADGEPESLRWAAGAAALRITARLEGDAASGLAAAAEALAGARHTRLLAALEAFLATPPLAASAAGPAPRVHRAVARDVRRLIRAAAALDEASTEGAAVSEEGKEPGVEHDAALHTVRKAAKRLRYSAELVLEGVPDGPAKRLKYAHRASAGARKIQQILGQHQDSVMARALLIELARQPAGEQGAAAGDGPGGGSAAFGLGRLHAVEDARAAAAEKSFRALWRKLRRRL